MSDRLKYDLVPSQTAGYRFTVDIPQPVWHQISADRVLTETIANLAANRTNALSIETTDSGRTISINDKRIGARKPARGDSLTRGAAKLLASLDIYTDSHQKDPSFEASIGTQAINSTGRYGLHLKVAWPQSDEGAVSELVTEHMRAAAIKLKYASKVDVPHLVYAQIHREQGVTLETNPIGSCSVGTDGMWYEPEQPVLELDAHNIYNHEQQLILLVGGIALARADTLLAAQ